MRAEVQRDLLSCRPAFCLEGEGWSTRVYVIPVVDASSDVTATGVHKWAGPY